MCEKSNFQYIRYKTFPVSYLFKHMSHIDSKEVVMIENRRVKTYSDRYITFAKSLSCQKCGITGKILALESIKGRSGDDAHFNLYAVNDRGEEILMTND